jgi:pimeloyl-ACP methyl ester carboxylesterase
MFSPLQSLTLLLLFHSTMSQTIPLSRYTSNFTPTFQPSNTTNPPPLTLSTNPYATFLTISSLPPKIWEKAYLLSTTLPKASHLYPHAATYTLYIPPTAFQHAIETNTTLPLVITVHGTGRRASEARDLWKPLADRRGVAVLAPLFPMGVGGSEDIDGYKNLIYESEILGGGGGSGFRVRYDEVLLGILDEIAVRWEGVIATERSWLTGFSGGGQFALRMWYLWPERWAGVSIGAPGKVTGLDWEKDWPAGVRDTEDVFGRTVDVGKMGAVPFVQLVVGGNDTATPGEGVLEELPGGQSRGDQPNRRDTMDALAEGLKGSGFQPESVVVPGVAHDSDGVFPAVEGWLDRNLQ